MPAARRLSILLVFQGSADRCPRAHRLALHLTNNGHSVRKLCSGGGDYDIVLTERGLVGRFLNLLLILGGRWKAYLSRRYDLQTPVGNFDVVVCHDLLLLPGVLENHPADRVVFDAREYYPAQFEDRALWRLTFGRLSSRILRSLLNEPAGFVTVSRGLQERYHSEFGRLPIVIHSYPAKTTIAPTRASEMLKAVHIGNTNSNRKLNRMIAAFESISNVKLDVYVVDTDASVAAELRKKASGMVNVQILAPVRFEEILKTLARYDIGIFFSPPSTYNLDNALPNKVFEYVQARLAVVVSPLKEVSRLVRESGVGFVTEGFASSDLAELLGRLTPSTVEAAKASSNERASNWNAETFGEEFSSLILEVFKRSKESSG